MTANELILKIVPTWAQRVNGDRLATELALCPFCLLPNQVDEAGNPISTCQHNAGFCQTDEPSIYFTIAI